MGLGEKNETLNLKEISDNGVSNTFNNYNLTQIILKKKIFNNLFWN